MSTARKAARPPRWQAAAASAETPAGQLAASYDRLRAGLKHLQRPQSDIEARIADCALAGSIAGEAARLLGALADRIDHRKDQP